MSPRNFGRPLLAAAIVLAACAPEPSSKAPAATPPARESAPAAATADLAPVLSELTQALRKFSAEQRRVPESLNELVAAGYLKQMPQAPAGRTFAIDRKDLKVVVK